MLVIPNWVRFGKRFSRRISVNCFPKANAIGGKHANVMQAGTNNPNLIYTYET